MIRHHCPLPLLHTVVTPISVSMAVRCMWEDFKGTNVYDIPVTVVQASAEYWADCYSKQTATILNEFLQLVKKV